MSWGDHYHEAYSRAVWPGYANGKEGGGWRPNLRAQVPDVAVVRKFSLLTVSAHLFGRKSWLRLLLA
jgi:hypothetical protein